MGFLLFVAAVGVVVALVVRRSCRTVERSQRLVIERMGRFLRCGGPGIQILVPFVDTGRLIELNDYVRGWQGMSEREVQEHLLAKLYGAPASEAT